MNTNPLQRAGPILGAGSPGAGGRSGSTLLTLGLVLGWLSLLWMVAGPPVSLPLFPDGARLYDPLWLGSAFVAFFLMARSRTFPRVRRTPLLLVFLIYVGLVLILPVIGLIFLPQAQLAWYLGDLRWAQLLSIAALFVLAYSERGYARFQIDLLRFLLALIALNALVLGAQVWLQNSGGPVPVILDVWYPEEKGAYGRHGFHINRYAGAMTYASSLALIGGVLLLVGLLSMGGSLRLYIIGFAGLVFVVAAGNRSLILGLPVLLCLVLLARLALSGQVKKLRISAVAGGLVAVSGVVWAAINLNLGRMFSAEGRITQAIGILIGDTTFMEVSGRGGDRWIQPIRESQDWTFLGTLINPSHALGELPVFDSLYVFLLAQSGPLLLGAFLIFFVSLCFQAWKIWRQDRSAGALPMAVVISFLPLSITQNLITGMPGRVFLTLAVIHIVVYFSYRHGRTYLLEDGQRSVKSEVSV